MGMRKFICGILSAVMAVSSAGLVPTAMADDTTEDTGTTTAEYDFIGTSSAAETFDSYTVTQYSNETGKGWSTPLPTANVKGG